MDSQSTVGMSDDGCEEGRFHFTLSGICFQTFVKNQNKRVELSELCDHAQVLVQRSSRIAPFGAAAYLLALMIDECVRAC